MADKRLIKMSEEVKAKKRGEIGRTEGDILLEGVGRESEEVVPEQEGGQANKLRRKKGSLKVA